MLATPGAQGYRHDLRGDHATDQRSRAPACPARLCVRAGAQQTASVELHGLRVPGDSVEWHEGRFDDLSHGAASSKNKCSAAGCRR